MKYLVMADHPALWFSGYGTHGLKVAKAMQGAGYDVTLYGAGQQAAPQTLDGVRVVGDVMFRDWMQSISLHAEAEKADAVLMLKDPYILDAGWLRRARHPLVMFTNVDTDTPSAAVKTATSYASAILTPTRYHVDAFKALGITAHFTPHGIDTDFWTLGDKAAARRALGWREDAFIPLFVGINKQNPSRKNVERLIEAWHYFCSAYPDSYLHLHTNTQGGVQVEGMAYDAFRIPRHALGFADAYKWGAGYYDRDYIRTLYRAADALVAIGNEGFCLPVVEAQACGTKIIRVGWSGLRETAQAGAGWDIPAQEPQYGVTRWAGDLGGLHFVPHVGAVVAALKAAYEARETDNRQAIRDGVKHYAWETVWEQHWLPTLQALDDLLMEAKIA